MDYQPNEIKTAPRTSIMDSASVVLGVVGVVLSCFYPIGLPCSALAILMAVLSRNNSTSFQGRSRTGLILGVVGFVLTIVILCVIMIAFFQYLSSSPSGVENFMDEMLKILDQPAPL